MIPLAEAHLAVWMLVFARLAGWAWFDPLVGRLPRTLRLGLAAALAAALAPGVSATAPVPFSVQGVLALGMEALWGAALALCVRLVFAAVSAGFAWFGHTATGGLLTLTAEQAEPLDAAWRALAGWPYGGRGVCQRPPASKQSPSLGPQVPASYRETGS